jgi:hypothetical protein
MQQGSQFCSRLFSWSFGLILLAWVGRGYADADQRLLRVLISAEQKEELQPVIDAVESQLTDLGVELSFEILEALPGSLDSQIELAHGLAQSHQCLAVVWWELASLAKIYIYYSEAEQGHILVRELREPDTSSRAEALAIIVRSSVSQLLAGQEIGVRAGPDQEQVPAMSASNPVEELGPAKDQDLSSTPSQSMPLGVSLWDLELGYWLQGYSGSSANLSGLSLGLGAILAGSWRIGFQYLVLQSLRRRGQTATLELHRHPMAVGLGYIWARGRIGLRLAAAFVLDVATFANVDIQPGYRGERGCYDLVFSVSPSLGLSYEPIDRLRFFLSLVAEIPLNRKEYAAMVRSEERESMNLEKTIVPWSVQPALLAGVAIDVFP